VRHAAALRSRHDDHRADRDRCDRGPRPRGGQPAGDPQHHAPAARRHAHHDHARPPRRRRVLDGRDRHPRRPGLARPRRSAGRDLRPRQRRGDRTALRGAGFTPRAEEVSTQQVADFGGFLGYLVRVGSFADKATADATLADIRARTGIGGSGVYTGCGPEDDSTGPWHVRVLAIDPETFEGCRTDGAISGTRFPTAADLG